MTDRESMIEPGTASMARPAAHGPTGPPAPGRGPVVMRVAGSGLLIATAAIHLDLYLTGYRSIPTIGWLFLLQVIAAFGLGLAVLAIPSRLVFPGRLTAAAGAGFALATLGGYLLSVRIGLFGFQEVRTTVGIVAGLVEVAAFAVLCALALAPVAANARPAVRAAGIITAALAAVALLLGLVVAGAQSAGPAAAGTTLKVATIRGTRVLTNAKGLTLYWFAPDTAASSKCYGSCAAYWPPVTGTPAAGSGLQGKTGTIRRSDGFLQLTYDGHPLYTYIGDGGPGQDRGDNLDLNGGLWHEVPASPRATQLTHQGA